MKQRDLTDTNLLKRIAKTIAYCGLICALDSCFKNCEGCRSGKGCGDSQCLHKECCAAKGLCGCWECADFPCSKGYFAGSHPSRGQFVGCIRYIKKYGLENYVYRIAQYINHGIIYGLNGAYATMSEERVLEMLEADENTKSKTG